VRRPRLSSEGLPKDVSTGSCRRSGSNTQFSGELIKQELGGGGPPEEGEGKGNVACNSYPGRVQESRRKRGWGEFVNRIESGTRGGAR